MNIAVLDPSPRSRRRVHGREPATHVRASDRHPGQDPARLLVAVDADPEHSSRLPAQLPPLPPTDQSVPANFLG